MQDTEPISSEFSEAQYGSYRVMQPLGAGGMSSVYRAVHVDSGHEVALKVLPERMAKNPIVLQRFLREARTAESLEHPNIVSIFDRGVDHGRNYLVLEYVDGVRLARIRADAWSTQCSRGDWHQPTGGGGSPFRRGQGLDSP